MEQSTRKSLRRRRHVRYRRFVPEEPPILWGEFKDRKLSDLSDDELNRFMCFDARHQNRSPMPSFWGFPSSCPDLSQYWFAKYESERRKPETQRGPSIEVTRNDTTETIASKLFQYGYRAACRKYHPDHGGDKLIMQNINAALEFAKQRLKQ